LFAVCFTNSVLAKIAADVKTKNERIGLLIGVLNGDELWVTDMVSGGIEMNDKLSIITTGRLAKITNDVLSGKLSGSIVGWYHSHPGYGIFMSEIDIETQIRLQQFSPYIIAMVIDPTRNEFGLWTLDRSLGLVQIPEEYIRTL